MLTQSQEELASCILELGAVKFGAFRLKLHEREPDAPLSPLYIDLRLLRSRPTALQLVARVYYELSRGLQFDCIADIPTAATPFVALLSVLSSRPMISPRMDRKEHGSGAQIDGLYSKGQTVLVVDDLITKAESKLEAVSVLAMNGLLVRDIVVLVDREQGGAAELKRRGYSCRSAITITQLLDFYKSTKQISADHYRAAIAYIHGE